MLEESDRIVLPYAGDARERTLLRVVTRWMVPLAAAGLFLFAIAAGQYAFGVAHEWIPSRARPREFRSRFPIFAGFGGLGLPGLPS